MSIDDKWLEQRIAYRGFTDAEREALSGALSEVQVTDGDRIVTQGQSGGVLYILRSGKAEIVDESHGSTVSIANVNEGALLGEMTFLTGGDASASVIARSDCVVYRLPRELFVGIMADQPELSYALFATMLANTAETIRHMNEEHIGMLQYIGGLGRMG